MENKWISVSEKLPEIGIKVLCFGHQMGMSPQMGGNYSFISERIELTFEKHNLHLRNQFDENDFRRAYVTHWQPLPEPPAK